MSKSDGNFVETDSMDIPNFLDKKDNTTAIIKTKPASSDIRDLNNFDLWRLHSSEYYWWHKQIIWKKRQKINDKANTEDLFAVDDSMFSYKNMDNIKEQEEGKTMGAAG